MELNGTYRTSFCCNTECRWHTEKKGGEFILSREKGGMYCPDCFYGSGPILPNMAKSAFDFTTTTISGKPIHVRSMQHLQRLEKEHGCSSVVLNCDRSNWDKPKMPRENWQTPPREVLPHGVRVPQR